MVELIATSPLDGLLPIEVDEALLSVVDVPYITSIMPHKGKAKAVASALSKAHDLTLPAIGRSTGKADLRVIWTGRDQYMLVGEKAGARALARSASLSDQSDGWVVLSLTGAQSNEILSRLCPLDLGNGFKRGHTARTEIAHMMAIVTRLSGGFEIFVMRSFAKTMAHDLQQAMESVAAQKRIC